MRRVIVTRPEPGARRTAATLTAIGFAPLLLPLTRIVPLVPTDAGDSPQAVCVAVSSANALRHAPEPLLDALRKSPVFAVGEETAAAARRSGLAVSWTGSGDASALALAIVARMPPGAEIVYLTGRVRTGDLEATLRRAGFAVRLVETYAAEPVDYDTGALATILGREPIAAILLYSAVAARLAVELPWTAHHRELLSQALCLSLSARIAAQVPSGLFGRRAVAETPTEESLLALLGAP